MMRSTMLAIATMLAASTASAQAIEQTSAYDQLVADAVAEYSASRYAEARALFAQAHALSPNARTLRGLGMASFELRDYVNAVHYLEQSLADDRQPLTDEQRGQVRDLLERSRAFVGRYRVELAPGDAELLVDDAPAELTAEGELLLNLGTHQLRVECSGCEPLTRSVRVRGGEEETLSLVARRSSGGSDDSAESAEIPGSSGGGGVSWPLIIAGGAFVVGVAVGAVWWVGRSSEIDDCDAAGDLCFNEDTLASERTGAIALTIGSAALAVGFVVAGLVVGGGGDDSDDRASSCTPTIVGLRCDVRF